MRRKLVLHELLAAAALLAVGPLPWVICAEPVDQFLTALRERKFYDEAIDYLKLVELHAHLPESTRQRALYEQGATLLEQAAGTSDAAARNAQLSRATELFEQFGQKYPQHELAGSATSQIANILIQRGRNELQSATAPDRPDKETVLADARKYFEQARQHFATAEKAMDERLQKIPKLVAPTDKDLQTQKRQIAGDLAQVRLLRASIDYLLATTFDAESADAKKLRRSAAKNYATLYETYRTRSVGLLARWREGRCYQELGQFKQALGCFQELIDVPASAETRAVRTMSTRSALECWTDDSQRKYQEAIECGERWEAEAGASASDDDALAIRYLTALACEAQSKALPAKDPNRKKLAGHARQFVFPVAQHPGQYQRPAKILLVALGGKDQKDQKEGGQNVTFAEAYEQGRQALERMQQATADLTLARQGGDRAAIDRLEKQKRDSSAAALESLRIALNKSDSKTPIEDLNSARYYLCYLAWDRGQFYDAAVLGEFLAQRYPDSLPGRQGARIALAACVRLHNDAKAADKDFERAHIERVAELIFKRWPDKEESDDAALTMLNFTVVEHQFDKALEYLGKISANSPRRGQAELRAGQAIWSAYLRALQEPADERPTAEQMDQLKKLAQDILAQGIARMEKAEKVDATLAAAVLAIAQIWVETGQPAKAVEWLENPKIGPLGLLTAGSPAVAREGFDIETYKVALRAYIAVQPQQLKKAEDVMDQLEKLVQKDSNAAASANLTAIYVSLGRELQRQLEELRKTGKKEEMQAVSSAFEVFLDRIVKRESGGSYASLNWVGETYFGLGSGFDDGQGPPPAQAKAYFQKAAAAYESMLQIAAKDPKFKDQPESLIGIRLRLADCASRGGDFKAALESLVGILKEKPTRLNVQIQAAQLYQAHGVVDPKGYAQAIVGGSPGSDGKNVVWGWAKISQMTLNRPEFQEAFHQARLNLAEARHAYALIEKDEAKKKKILEAAKQDLWMTYKLRPDLGGNETAARYDRLLKQIQKSLGNKETGLTEFKEREATAPAT
jgi:hypothetical protein